MLVKRSSKITVAIVFLAIILMSVSLGTTYVHADSGNVSGNTKVVKSFNVTTGNKDKNGNYIVLKSGKGIMNCNSRVFNWKSTLKHHGFYYVYVTNKKTGYTWWTTMYKKDLKIKLNPNTTYEIKVEPRNASLFAQMSFLSTWKYTSWKTHATWYVSKTNGVKSCK